MTMHLPILSAFLLATTAAVAQQEAILALNGLDPVELCQGREVEGDSELGCTSAPYRYRFASEANLRTFQGDPERYGIQWGGACGRMGPLSGRGHPERFAVHDGRIYLFASDQCRAGFLKDPSRMLPAAEEELRPEPKSRAAAMALLAKARQAVGGDAVVDGWQALRCARREIDKTDGGERIDTHTLLATRDGRIRVDETWGEYRFRTLVLPGGSCTVGNDGKVEPLSAAGVRELQLAVLRQPLVLLGRVGSPGFAAATAGKDQVGGREVELVEVQCDGVRTTLGIDGDGRLLLLRYRGRGPQLWYGSVQWTFADHRKAGAATLPYEGRLTFDGKPQPEPRRFERIELDPELDADCFAPRR